MVKRIDKILDSIFTNKYFGLPIFLLILWLIFFATFNLGQYPMGWLEKLFATWHQFLSVNLKPPLLRSLIVDGVIAGVGSVLVFVPNILILFFGISILENTGYMARAAQMLNRIMHKFGLSGRSFLPMLLGFGCSVPAFLACQNIKNKADRLTTMLVIPFISCSAKLPLYVLMIGAFFAKQASTVLFLIYISGIIIAIIMAKLLKKIFFNDYTEKTKLKLPPYRLPSLKDILLSTWEKAWEYIKKAGTVLLWFSVIIWFISNYPAKPGLATKYQTQVQLLQLNRTFSERQKSTQIALINQKKAAEQLEYSIAGWTGRKIEPLIKPLGFNWKIGIALITGFSAKEVVVSTLGTFYAIDNNHKNSSIQLLNTIRNSPDFSPLIALALIAFVALYVPCIAASVVFHKEVGAWRWTLFYLFYTTGLAYLAAFLIFQIGKIFI